jgi:hypothetical protein
MGATGAGFAALRPSPDRAGEKLDRIDRLRVPIDSRRCA